MVKMYIILLRSVFKAFARALAEAVAADPRVQGVMSSKGAFMSSKIVIVDYGMGNLHSVNKAIAVVGGDPVISSDAAVIAQADKLIYRSRGFWRLHG